MGVIQSSLNQAITTAMAGALGVEHIKDQQLSERAALPEQIIAGKREAEALKQDIEQIAGEQQSLEAEVSGQLAEAENRSPRYEGRDDAEYLQEADRLDKAMRQTIALQKAQEKQTQMKVERFKSLTKKWGGID